MSANTQNLTLVHAGADCLIALSCFLIAASLLTFARRNRGARLAHVFSVFSLLFACGGLMHVCEATGWYAAGAILKSLTALTCAACAALTVRCLPAARTMFARLAVIERKAGERRRRLASDPRYDTPEDREWQSTLAEIQDLARLAREVRAPEEV